MFAIGAFLAGLAIAAYVDRVQRADPEEVDTNIRHSRQDLRLISYLLFAILIALGMIADRIH